MNERYGAARLCVAAVAVFAQGCALADEERVVAPDRVRTTIQPLLGAPLAKVPRIDTTNAFVDVDATYVGRTKKESVLIVVFRSTRATAQLVGKPAARVKGVIRNRNVVILYRHAPGTRNRARQFATSLREI